MNIRALTEKDTQIVEELEQKSDFMISGMIDSDNYGYGIFDNEKLIGFCSIGCADTLSDEMDEIGYRNYDIANDLLLSDVFIDPAYQNKGYGTMLIKNAIRLKQKSEKRITNIFITVLYDDVVPFYEKLGFEWVDQDAGILVKKANP